MKETCFKPKGEDPMYLNFCMREKTGNKFSLKIFLFLSQINVMLKTF